MLVTLTLNPTIDLTLRVDVVALGTLHRPREALLNAAGKGINVSRIADRLHCPTIAFGLAAGEIGDLIERILGEEGVQHFFLRIPGQTRINVTIAEASGRGTSFYGRGPSVDPKRLDQLEHEIRPWLKVCRVLVLAGSLPPGVPVHLYARYIEIAREADVRTILDTSGEALRHGLEARPSLIKPNRREAEALLGRPLPDVPALLEGARELRSLGAGAVVISAGAEGALAVDERGAWQASPPAVEVRTTVGSGDSMVAGFAVAALRGQPLEEGLRLGTAAGAATAAASGTALASAEDIERLLPEVQLKPLPG